MARDYDSQLLESVAVRRQRLREAVLFGRQRSRRRLDEGVGKVIASVCLAAVACAGTVGWSFVSSQLTSQREAREQAEAGPPNVAPPPVPAEWVGARVTLTMLREELRRAEVPRDLYVLPGDPRPPEGTLASYYLLTEDEDSFSVGIIEFGQGRTGAEFTSMNEAARWLHRQLVLEEAEPDQLSAAEERQAAARSAELIEEVEGKLAEASGDSVAHTLAVGEIVDAFGPESGSLLFPEEVPFNERGLPDYVRSPRNEPAAADSEDVARSRHRYRVIHPFQVTASLAPSTAEHPGGGVRFSVEPGGFSRPVELPSIRWLLGNGYLERIAAGGQAAAGAADGSGGAAAATGTRQGLEEP
ncbi:TNT domain-containing protein [Salinactinospora qingdaonensis]|uniref:TNT domain-containing protein n=1 Tax=Salinactinospora qingdaonensis TaxID=702744 RepID=A0ABP7GGB3_9ACTN